MNTTAITSPWFCLFFILLPILVAAFFSTLSSPRYTRKIKEAQSIETVEELNSPEQKRKRRTIAAIGLIGWIGNLSALGLLFLKLAGVIIIPIEIILVLFEVTVLISIIAGIFLYRGVSRKL
jgi:hypothetical protein